MAQLADFPMTEMVIKQMADEIGQNYADLIGMDGHNASYTLSNAAKDSTLHKIRVEGSSLVATFDLPSYWKYVENDTKPHWPPERAIADWIEIKPVIPYPGRNGRLPSPQQLNFLIRRKIATVGTTGTHEMERTVQHTIAFWEERLARALSQDLSHFVGLWAFGDA